MANGKTRKPTLKQRLTAAKLIENHGNMTKSMIQAGYSPNTAKSAARNLTKTDAWQDLMEKHYPDSLLARNQKQLINATALHKIEYSINTDDKIIRKDIKSISGSKIVRITQEQSTNSKGVVRKYKTVVYTTPVHDVRQKAIDTAMKTKNKFPAQKHEVAGEDGGPFIVQVVSYDPDEKPTEEDTI